MPITGGLLVKWTALGATVGTLAVGAAQIATEAPRAVQAPTSSARPAARPRPGSVPGAARAVAAPATTLPGARGALADATADAPRDFVLADATADAPRDVAPTAPTAVVQREAIASTPAAALTRPAVPEAAPGLAGPRTVAPEAPAASGVPLDAETLAEEVKSVDRARAALAAGQAAQTLVVLDEYERRFRKRGFAPEALYLRMEAYTSLGRTAEARTAAERLLTNYPNSLHGARARAVLAKNP
jgi:hypothetical protein